MGGLAPYVPCDPAPQFTLIRQHPLSPMELTWLFHFLQGLGEGDLAMDQIWVWDHPPPV